ncbi:MAG: RodZ domain-containing protein, partial [Sneathiella sp.]
NLLNLDAVAIVELYKHEEGGGLRVHSLAFPEPTTGGRMPGAGILLGTLVAALILLAGWFFYQESESLDFERVAELPEHLAGKIRDLEVIGTNDPAVADKIDDADASPKNMAEILQASPSTEAPVIKDDETTGQAADSGVAATNTADTMSQRETNSEATAVPGSEAIVVTTLPEESTDIEIVTVEETSDIATTGTSENTTPAPVAENTEGETETVTAAPASSEDVATSATSSQETEVVANYPQDTLQAVSSGESAMTTDGSPESPMPRTFGVENTDARVVLRATEESWVQVKSEDDNPVLSQVLKPGDTYMAPNTPDLKLTTGNAGGLEIRVDGKEIKSLGGTGTILREIPFAADSLL